MEQAEKAIDLLQQFIDANRYRLSAISAFGRNKLEGSHESLSQTDDKAIDVGMVAWTGHTHFEAAVAALFRFPDEAILNCPEDMRKLISVRHVVLITSI
jgi:hypothetical protein